MHQFPSVYKKSLFATAIVLGGAIGVAGGFLTIPFATFLGMLILIMGILGFILMDKPPREPFLQVNYRNVIQDLISHWPKRARDNFWNLTQYSLLYKRHEVVALALVLYAFKMPTDYDPEFIKTAELKEEFTELKREFLQTSQDHQDEIFRALGEFPQTSKELSFLGDDGDSIGKNICSLSLKIAQKQQSALLEIVKTRRIFKDCAPLWYKP